MRPIKFSNFYVRSGLFGVLSIAGAALNYALYPLLTRILSTNDFGDFAAIVALSNQVLSVLLAFNIISIYLVKAHTEEEARKHTQTIQKTLIWFFLALTLLVFAASPFLHNLLKIENPASFLVLAILLSIAIPIVVWTGYLQGHKEMIRIGVFNLSSSVAKLVTASSLAMVFGTVGGMVGLLGGAVAGLIALKLYPGVKLPQLGSVFRKSSTKERRFMYGLKGYFIQCLLVVGGLGFLQNFDITLAKALFSADTAGVYSGISILSNALYYLSFLLVWIILPEIKINDADNNRRILGTAYSLLGGLAVVTLAFELLFRNQLSGLLLGAAFSGQGSLLLYATLYQFILVAITLYAFYLLVCRRKQAALLGLLVIGCVTIAPALYATSPLEMIQLMSLGALSGTVVYLVVARFSGLLNQKTRANEVD